MRRLLAATVLTLAIACGKAPTVPSESIPGTYRLASVNDAPLPSTIQEGPPKREVVADQLVLADSGRFTEQRQERTTTNGASTIASITDGGTWTLDGNAITLRYADGFRQIGEAGGDGSLTFKGEKIIVVYRRQ